MANARKVAVKALTEVSNNKAYSNITLNKVFDNNPMNHTEKAFATALFYGVLDRKLSIDYIISIFVKKGLKKITPITLEALRIAVYQIYFMDKVPDSAAVNESVNIVKASKERFNASFVNGVLRNVLREKPNFPSDDSAESLSVRYSCPKWIINSFVNDYGVDTAKLLLDASLQKPPVTLRVNTVKISADELIIRLENEGLKVEKLNENALNILSGIDVKDSNCYKEGLFHIQDLASQKSIEKLDLKPQMRVLDLCSAPGGKSFTAAGIMENTGEILSFDLYEKRVELIKRSAKRLGFDIIKAHIGDATVFDEKLGLFDAVICDVPCSGLGVIRRKPEIKYKDTEDFKELQSIQKKILENASRYLKQNGKILYTTCTLRCDENENIVSDFLKSNNSFKHEYEKTYMPHIDGTDGFFCALLIKKQN